MKTFLKYNLNLFLLIILALSYSCRDSMLDVEPRDRLADINVYTDKNAADMVLNDIYGNLPNGNQCYEPFDHWTDNGINGYSWTIGRNEARECSWKPDNVNFWSMPIDLYWDSNYKKIRKCNIFISNVESSRLPADYKNLRIAEARFLRAYFYQLLWMAYGGVPVVTEVLNYTSQGDSIFQSRNTFDETYAFIRNELAAIIDNLPNVPAETGRVSKGAALTLKGWVELFANKFQESAETNKRVIDELGNGNVYELFGDYGSLFMPENNVNKEGIFYKEYIPRIKGGNIEGIWGIAFTKDGIETSWGAAGPTQELVDDYAMSNGKPITDPTSGYNPQDPYKNRESRFYQSIVFDGSFFYNDTIWTRVGVNSPNEIDLSDHNDATQTGYGLRKRLNEKITFGADNWGGNTSGQNYYIFRYAEVLLNYAEAKNEVSGPDQTVIKALDEIRSRAKLPSVQSTFGTLTKDQMRELIRRERRIELAFEDKRYWDLMRWRIAETKMNGELHGMKIEKVNGKWTYTPTTTPGGSKTFHSWNYFFPIPTSAMDKNKKLTQNPGY